VVTVTSVLLLNPPAPSSVFRDCYCSGETKGTFFIHPLDLQIQSGFLAANGFSPLFLDSIFERLDVPASHKRIGKISPKIILALISDSFRNEEVEFFRAVKKNHPDCRLFISGDVARFNHRELFQQTGNLFDGILMNFCSPGLVDHLQGQPASDMLFPDGTGTFSPPRASKRISFPLPWSTFPGQYAYALPFFRTSRYYSLLTAFGCPYSCKYCNVHQVGFAFRALDEVMAEMAFAAESGFKSIYFRDATFLSDRKRTWELFDRWEKAGFDFEWMCFTRPELIDEEIAERAAKLKCRMMMIGVESYDAEWLAAMNKPISIKTIMRTFQTLRKHRIGTAAELMVGMTNEQIDLRVYSRKIKQFINQLDPDFIALSVFERRPGVEGEHPSFQHIDHHREDYKKLEKTINQWFYMRPRTMWRQLMSIRSMAQLQLYAKTALHY